MKHVVSVSLGSSSRNHKVIIRLFGQEVLIERLGTDGDRQKVIAAIQSLDGQVDAFGMGGIDRYIYVNNRRYTFREAEEIASYAKRSPIVDGSGLKNSLERHVVHLLADHPLIRLRGKKVLLVSGVDRFGMAEALVAIDCVVLFGDLMFGLGLPLSIRSLKGLDRAARMIAPLITRLPIRFLYPTGDKQQEIQEKFAKHYREADVIAGDFHFIRRHLPKRLDGKIVLTNTVTQDDVELLRARGVKHLVTTTPDLEGRSFGTNVIEALLIAIQESRQELAPVQYLALLDKTGFVPRIETLTSRV
ncbi:quinate 5-dehydrogenase [Tumebacillus algifaecis]|uniref:Quinate 5-dehydrogenase n=1 Tax=Tumebacillus algifaecis TaxID=1214604 RepID=A0A223D5U8_9BACL|nr:quinate 5-dehydrogenase [Tumebacillus algifaecis]ASS76969.1 quinate 5-dehydrogenase [Tumebacillus algifaecis]